MLPKASLDFYAVLPKQAGTSFESFHSPKTFRSISMLCATALSASSLPSISSEIQPV
jgi:hypothetical protein